MKDAYLGTAIKCVESGGKILINYFRKLHDARQKNENKRDIVTEVDLLAEQKIRHIISNQFPDHNVVGEETDTPAGIEKGLARKACSGWLPCGVTEALDQSLSPN